MLREARWEKFLPRLRCVRPRCVLVLESSPQGDSVFCARSLLLIALVPLGGSVHGQTPAGQRQQIQDFVRAYAAAANRGDVTAYVEMYTRNPDLIVINDGEITRGWDRLRDDANATLGSEGSYKISVGTIDVMNLGGTRAIAMYPFVLTVTSGQGPVQLRGAMTLVLEKSAQGWKIIHDHTSTAPEDEGIQGAEASESYLGVMQSDLRNLVIAEEAY